MFDYRVISFGPATRRRVFAVGIAGGLLVTLAGSAQAQFFGWWGTPPAYGVPENAMISPNEIYRLVAGHGYQISGRLERNGRVYMIDVIDPRGRAMRLVIDAYEGDILQRFATAPPRPMASIPQPEQQSRAELDPQYSEPSASGYPRYPTDRNSLPPAATNQEPQVIPGIGHAAGDRTHRSRATKTQTAAREAGGTGEPARPRRPARAEAAPPQPRGTPGSEAALPQPAAKIAPAIGPAASQPPAKPEKETATAESSAKSDPVPAAAAPPAPAPAKPAHQKADGPGYANGVPINPLD